VPFLRLTRDRRGFEHTFLMHAGTGEAPRVLYWYRTAPGVLIGRPALDEEAIRGLEEQHPEIEFDWPAILALREALPPEEEPAAAFGAGALGTGVLEVTRRSMATSMGVGRGRSTGFAVGFGAATVPFTGLGDL
jgi:hypothetical protein